MSNAGASLIVSVFLIGLALYFMAVPPAGFEGFWHRIAIPLVLVVGAVTIFENLRMRAHMTQLIGALRGALGRSGVPPTADVKREAVEILIRSLRSENPSVRRTAAAQLSKLTGQSHGENADAWQEWWEENRSRFGAPGAP